MRTNAVQFRGVDDALTAYDHMKVAAWSLWNGPKQLMLSYSGDDMEEGAHQLREFLDMLVAGRSEAAYTLKVYKDPKGEINSATPFSYSFNFTLFDPEKDENTSYYQKRTQQNRELDERLKRIEDALLVPQDDEPEQVGGIQGIIAGILKMPGVQEQIVGRLLTLVDKVMPNNSKLGAVAGVAAPSANAQTAIDNMPEDQFNLVNEALAILAQHDPQIGTHLMALAKIARDNPGKYAMALKFL